MTDTQFSKKLKALLKLSQNQNNTLSEQQVTDFIKSEKLSENHKMEVSLFLEENNVEVLRDTSDEPDSAQEYYDDGICSETVDFNEEDCYSSDCFTDNAKTGNTAHKNNSASDNDIDSTKQYMMDIREINLLDAEEELALAKTIKEHPDPEVRKQALDKLIVSNLKLVIYVAKKYHSTGLAFNDLIQEGNIGLFKAAQRFDYTKGNRFSTYATHWIRQAISRALTDKDRIIRIPVHVSETLNHFHKAEKELMQELDRKPSLEEIADKLQLSVEKVRDLEKLSRDTISLDSPVGDEEDGCTIADFISGEASSPETLANKGLLKDEIHKLLATLRPRERQIIMARFGIQDGSQRTLEEVGQMLGITRERVRQIEAKALRSLKRKALSRDLLDYVN